jgi:sensor histidine kinase YesM
MQALRAQINPHFIFNCLSSINCFILRNDTKQASNYLSKFSRLIRLVLNNSTKTVVTLADEIDILRLYLAMERLRFRYPFETSFHFKNEIDVDKTFVPPLLLQPFVENAIWHGLMHKEQGGYIHVEFASEEGVLTCVISDNGIGRNKAALIKSNPVEKQPSMGLQITTERLALLCKGTPVQSFFNIDDVTDDEGYVAGTRVTLKIPCKERIQTLA